MGICMWSSKISFTACVNHLLLNYKNNAINSSHVNGWSFSKGAPGANRVNYEASSKTSSRENGGNPSLQKGHKSGVPI